uniref:Uncharacterized protein n=1 Tax=Oryza sativa subsp. japonica TaxID=39947 RepID=Q5Z6D7_ORYSJ|nr:hypothetical protein [Oryza sativa Japonica Group]
MAGACWRAVVGATRRGNRPQTAAGGVEGAWLGGRGECSWVHEASTPGGWEGAAVGAAGCTRRARRRFRRALSCRLRPVRSHCGGHEERQELPQGRRPSRQGDGRRSLRWKAVEYFEGMCDRPDAMSDEFRRLQIAHTNSVIEYLF